MPYDTYCWPQACDRQNTLYHARYIQLNFTAYLQPTCCSRDLAEAQPNALEIISKEAIAAQQEAQKAAQPKVPPITIIPRNPEGQAFSWSIDGNRLGLGRAAGSSDMLQAVEGITVRPCKSDCLSCLMAMLASLHAHWHASCAAGRCCIHALVQK